MLRPLEHLDTICDKVTSVLQPYRWAVFPGPVLPSQAKSVEHGTLKRPMSKATA